MISIAHSSFLRLCEGKILNSRLVRNSRWRKKKVVTFLEIKGKEMKWKKSISSFFCPSWDQLHHFFFLISCESLFVRVEIIFFRSAIFPIAVEFQSNFFLLSVENEFAPKKSASYISALVLYKKRRKSYSWKIGPLSVTFAFAVQSTPYKMDKRRRFFHFALQQSAAVISFSLFFARSPTSFRFSP